MIYTKDWTNWGLMLIHCEKPLSPFANQGNCLEYSEMKREVRVRQILSEVRVQANLKCRVGLGCKQCTGSSIGCAPGCYAGGREFETPTGPTLRIFKLLRRKCCLCNFICKWLDFLVFSHKDVSQFLEF